MPLTLEVTQRRQAFWQSAGSFDRSVNFARRLFRGERLPGRAGAMTPKIACFLAAQKPATPCLVLDVDRVAENFCALRRALPLAQIYYAVKANPAPQVLERLVGLRSSFDAASFEEIQFCLMQGRGPRRSASATRSKKSRRSAARMKLAYRSSLSIRRRSWTSSPATRPAAGSIAACWSRTPAPTGRCHENSAQPSRWRARS